MEIQDRIAGLNQRLEKALATTPSAQPQPPKLAHVFGATGHQTRLMDKATRNIEENDIDGLYEVCSKALAGTKVRHSIEVVPQNYDAILKYAQDGIQFVQRRIKKQL
ncbi:hypothetical protein UFOVP119_67 [uncultured Caudovirales phage]|uniref:Uncharacterized protein n=1 Tax=uncultured Caudovirales phage TaxID=2100421 RepID=A0A6J5LAX8_9CAUD|nr:hypothetical protein UFOVP119_67 [uncultured Caudovirales phage]